MRLVPSAGVRRPTRGRGVGLRRTVINVTEALCATSWFARSQLPTLTLSNADKPLNAGTTQDYRGEGGELHQVAGGERRGVGVAWVAGLFIT